MPVSGEMRLRQLILALVALAGIWVGLAVQRSHHGSAPAAFTAGPPPPDFPAPRPTAPKLVHVPGLSRPAAATPIVVKVSHRPVARASSGTAPRPTRARRPHVRTKPAQQPSTIEAAADDSRNYTDTPPPPLDPLAITNVQVSALTSSSARITWQTNIPTLEQAAFGLDGPTVWTAPSSQVRIDHVSDVTGLEFSTTYTAYLHAVDEWNRAQTATVTFTTGPMLDSSNARTSS